MRYSQANGFELPIYDLISQEGLPHSRVFLVSISIKKNKNSEKIEIGLESFSFYLSHPFLPNLLFYPLLYLNISLLCQ